MATKVVELYGLDTSARTDWNKVVAAEKCPFLGRKCVKTRKTEPTISIGTCTVDHGGPVIICPIRLREKHQIFFDAMHLFALHEPGNELHAVPEVAVPGGSLDFVLVSARVGEVRDFVGIEIQTLDTTGTLWPERQRFIKDVGLSAKKRDVESARSFGMNWKMTAKTILMQLHHKIQTFEHLNKRLVLAVQDRLLKYMEGEFSFGHLHNPARNGDSMQLHSYELLNDGARHTMNLAARKSTDAAGIATALGLQTSAKVELEVILATLQDKLSPTTRLQMAPR